MKRPDLLFLVVIWLFFSAFLYFIGMAAIAVFALPEALGFGNGSGSTGAVFGLGVAVLILLASLVVCLLGGIGVLQGKVWGRTLAIVAAVLSLFSFPIGTVIGVLVIVYMMRAEVKAYFEGASASGFPGVSGQ
jgi:hypothetical protein